MRHIEHTNYIHINRKRMHENLYLTKRIEENEKNFYLQADTTIKDAIDVCVCDCISVCVLSVVVYAVVVLGLLLLLLFFVRHMYTI